MDTPERIYLQVSDEPGDETDIYADEITWCADRINDNDIEYVLASKYKQMLEALQFLDTTIRYNERHYDEFGFARIHIDILKDFNRRVKDAIAATGTDDAR